MPEEQPMPDIQLFNYSFDNARCLTKVIYRGREAAIAAELGHLLRYAKNGGK